MYIPKHFEQKDVSILGKLIQSAPLGILIVNGPDGFEANHIPFIHRDTESGLGVLRAHIPRANPLSGNLNPDTACLVIFTGPQGYISPSWYATKKEHGRVVPTWNYSVAHVYGRVSVIDDAEWILAQLNELTDQNENGRREPWSVSDAPADYIQTQIGRLVGLEVTIERFEGKTKASQNQPGRNRASVLTALSNEQADSALARLMHDVLDHRR